MASDGENYMNLTARIEQNNLIGKLQIGVPLTVTYSNIPFATKATGVDGGFLGQTAMDDDYFYVCTTAGIAGVAVWKRTILFNT